MQTTEDTARAVALGNQIRDLLIDARTKDPQLSGDHVAQALSLALAYACQPSLNGKAATVKFFDNKLLVFRFYAQASFAGAFPNQVTPDLQAHIAALQRELSGAPPAGHA